MSIFVNSWDVEISSKSIPNVPTYFYSLLLISGMFRMLRSGSVEWKVINTRRTRQVAAAALMRQA